MTKESSEAVVVTGPCRALVEKGLVDPSAFIYLGITGAECGPASIPLVHSGEIIHAPEIAQECQYLNNGDEGPKRKVSYQKQQRKLPEFLRLKGRR